MSHLPTATEYKSNPPSSSFFLSGWNSSNNKTRRNDEEKMKNPAPTNHKTVHCTRRCVDGWLCGACVYRIFNPLALLFVSCLVMQTAWTRRIFSLTGPREQYPHHATDRPRPEQTQERTKPTSSHDTNKQKQNDGDSGNRRREGERSIEPRGAARQGGRALASAAFAVLLFSSPPFLLL